jgi:hypothetical protein
VETVAFYSYKGGVGRSMLLAHAARVLANLGKGVVALDFDLEAPGLHYKLGGDQTTGFPTLSFLGGAVPYLIATNDVSASPPALEEHMIDVPVPQGSGGWIRLMPAGPAPHQPYWAALKEFNESLSLGDPSGQGIMALLDLQARIADELKPDYLLIDARTGVTELGSLATTVLADTVVCMFVGNRESLDGTVEVIQALRRAPRLANQGPIRIVPVLSRATETDRGLAAGVARSLKLGDVFSLPHDDLATSEVLGLFSPLFKAYLELFQRIFLSAIVNTQSTPPKNL